MKNYILSMMLLLSFGILNAQSGRRPAMPDQGFWVIQNNVKSPKESVVFFYNSNKELIFKQTVSGKKLKVSRPKIVRRLNAALDEAIIAWNRAKSEGWAVRNEE